VQGLGEGEGREGEDGCGEGEEPGRAWGHGWVLWLGLMRFSQAERGSGDMTGSVR